MYNQGMRYNTTTAISTYLTKQITIMCMPRLHHTLHMAIQSTRAGINLLMCRRQVQH